MGYTFTTIFCETKGVAILAGKGRHGCVECGTVIYVDKLIFDTQAEPVLSYSADIWALYRLSNKARAHTFVYKLYLKF